MHQHQAWTQRIYLVEGWRRPSHPVLLLPSIPCPQLLATAPTPAIRGVVLPEYTNRSLLHIDSCFLVSSAYVPVSPVALTQVVDGR